MIRVLHPIAGAIGLLCIAASWTSTVAVEVLGGPASILAVKTVVLWGFLVLVPAMAAVGATGFRMAGRSAEPHVARKRRRVPLIALNGLFTLLPGAVFLQARAAAGDFGGTFALVHGIRLLTGAMNLALMSLGKRDAFALARRFAKARMPEAQATRPRPDHRRPWMSWTAIGGECDHD